MIRAALFDFDGTLADSFAPITASVNHVRALHGLPAMTELAVRELVGLGLPQLMRDIVPGVHPDETTEEYRVHHPSVMLTQTKLLPGVAQTLRTLKSRGYPLAVCSNKRVDFTRVLVGALGLGEFFAEVLGPDDVGGEPKPHPAMLLEAARRLGVTPAEALYVGDMAVDVHAAKAGGLPVWLVPGGAVGRENPLDAGPDRALKDFAELADLLPGVQPVTTPMTRENISTGGKWEPIIGYSRAVKVGPFVYVSGCTSATAEGVQGKGDPYAQAIQTLKTVVDALHKAGAKPEHVVRTRIYLTRMADWQEVGRAHGEVFGACRPATAMVEVSGLIDPDMLVEIEADAIVPTA